MHCLRRMPDGFQPRKTLLLMLFCQRVSRCSCSRWRKDGAGTLLVTHWLIYSSALTASIAYLDTVAIRVVLGLICKVDSTTTHWWVSGVQINDQIVSNNVSVRWLRLVDDAGCNDFSFVGSPVRESSSINVLSPVPPFIIQTHVSMMNTFWSSYSWVCWSGSYHHIVDFEIVSQCSPNRHSLVQRVNEFLSRMTAVWHLCWFNWWFCIMIVSLCHVELIRLDRLF